MLRSTMGSYERLVIEAVYGETMIRSVEIIWEILAWEEWLECSHNSLSMFDIPGLTLVCTSYVIFFGFHDIKIYILCFKIYIFIKRTLEVSDFILTRWCSKKVFDCLWVLKKRLIHRHSIFIVTWYMMIFILICVYIYIYIVTMIL